MFTLRGVISFVFLFLVGAKAIFINDTLKGNELVGRAFNPGPPDLTLASWIWTTTSGVTGVLPGSSAFRLTFHPSPNFPLANITFNNTLVGNSPDWTVPNVWTITNVPSNGPWVFAVMATNYPDAALSSAGVIASFRASNDAQQAFYSWHTGQIATPATPSVVWKGINSVPNNFAMPTFDDSAWPSAVIEAPYGGSPWGRLPAPVPKSL
ncbi:hypothetical protein DFH08DRAFT_968516 [Mycena albidolilacea]|uniref:Uncharacterized protein n=1 Tax=Mycena albidolilacea TaxID=1033008 RepID=A0AAD6ZKD5_9AGAR|nr:hypothetical protein DFH08DRAFT_968516 [Mycena albidolilacea]